MQEKFIKLRFAMNGLERKEERYGEELFKDLSGRTDLVCVELSDDVNIIPEYAFKGCKKLTYVKARGVRRIEKGAFCGCEDLEELSISRTKLLYVGRGVFEDCNKLRDTDAYRFCRTIENFFFSLDHNYDSVIKN